MSTKELLSKSGPNVMLIQVPVEFYITGHARERMINRVGCSLEKIEKLTRKAWQSVEKINPAYLNKQEYKGRAGKSVYRQFMGFIYIFELQKICVFDGYYHQKRLITVYN